MFSSKFELGLKNGKENEKKSPFRIEGMNEDKKLQELTSHLN